MATKVRRKKLPPKPQELTGYALTEHLETDPTFMSMLILSKGGLDGLPRYVEARFLQGRVVPDTEKSAPAADITDNHQTA